MVGENNKNILSSNDKCYDVKKTKEGHKEKQRRDRQGVGDMAILFWLTVQGQCL